MHGTMETTPMKKGNLFLVASVVFILLAVALVAILDRTSPGSQTSDVRARAGTQYTLKLVGVVAAVDEAQGKLEVTNLQFAPESRSGDAKDLGNWLVTPPAGFNFASVSFGMRVTIAVDSKTFQVTKHELTAVSLVPAQ